eukprot:697528-Rhodomonas_salina.1
MGRLEFSSLPRKKAMMKLCVGCLEHAINRLEGKNGMFGNVLWTCSVVLYPLYQLSIADSNKQDLVDAGVVEELLRLVRVWKQGEGGGTRDLEWALLTLEQLSFNDNARERIRSIIHYSPSSDTQSPTLASFHRLVPPPLSPTPCPVLGGAISYAEAPVLTTALLLLQSELNPVTELPRTRDTGGEVRYLPTPRPVLTRGMLLRRVRY